MRVVYIGHDVTERLAADPGEIFLVSRVVVAALATVLVYLVYRLGRRLYGAAAGLIAGALLGFAFLPVFYSHQALNDIVTLIPVTLAVWASLRAYEDGRLADFTLAGAMVGLAAGTKYSAGPIALVVGLAGLLRLLERKDQLRPTLIALVCSGVFCFAAFVLVNPFLVIDFDYAIRQYSGQSAQLPAGKIGQSGAAWSYYPYSLIWGLGAVPVAMALLGAISGLRSDRSRTLLLVLFPVVLYLYASTQGRFFARWMLPTYPILAVLAGLGAVVLATWVARRLAARGRTRVAGLALPTVALLVLAQPLADSVRSSVILTRTDTRTLALDHIREHLPPGARIVVEPAFPAAYLDFADVVPRPVERPFQEYESRLRPELVDTYREEGYCWVLVTSHQRDRGLAAGLSDAAAYYDRLRREADQIVTMSPYRDGASAPKFSFDFSYDWYPLAFERPGPEIEIVSLSDCTG
nr:glycosyltransferase family 39 protein [Nocardioides albus]